MARGRSETRAEERARGYFRPAARAGVSEYRYRTRGALTTEDRARAAGHRSIADLETTVRSRQVANADVTPGPEGAGGRRQWFDVVVEMRDGTTRTYRLQGRAATNARLRALADRLGRAGVKVAGIEYIAGRHRKAA